MSKYSTSMTNNAWSRSNTADLTQLPKAPKIAGVYLVGGLQVALEDDPEGDRCCLHGGIRLEGWVIPPASLCMHCLCDGGIEGPHSADKVEQHLNRQLLWRLLAAFAGRAGCSLPALVRLSIRKEYCTKPPLIRDCRNATLNRLRAGGELTCNSCD